MSHEPKRVVVAGGGVGALETVLALRELVGDAVSIELIAPAEDFVFAPMTVAAPFDRGGAARYSLAEFAHEQGASVRRDAVSSVEADGNMVVTASAERVPYEVLVVAIGARKADAVEGAVTFPGVGTDEALRSLLADLEAGEAQSLAFVIPRGATWALPLYELALLTSGQLERKGARGATIHLVTAEQSTLAVFGREASDGVGRLLAERDIVVHADADALRFRPGRLELAKGEAIPVDRAVALSRLRGPA
jgi:sulfide:quinone oxidoreductase